MGFRATALRQRSAGPLVSEAHQLGGRQHRSHEHGGLPLEGPAFHAWIEAAERPMTDVEDVGVFLPTPLGELGLDVFELRTGSGRSTSPTLASWR